MNYGCILSPEDKRDFTAASCIPIFGSVGATQDLELPEVEPDSQLGNTCVSHSIEVFKAQQELSERGKLQRFDPYFLDNSRQPGQVKSTMGWTSREAMKNLQKFGICRRGIIKSEPFRGEYIQLPQKALVDARYQRVESYFRIYTKDEMVSAVKLSGGFTVALPIYSNFATVRKDWNNPGELPIIPMPAKNEEPKCYHQVAAQGIMFSQNGIKILNSHGSYWGCNGYAILPFDYPIVERWASKDRYIPVPEVVNKDIVLWVGSREYMAGNKRSTMDVEPFIENTIGRTFVPLRFIAQSLGFMVKWVSEEEKVILADGFNFMTFEIGKNIYYDNNYPKFLEPNETPIIKNSRTFVPLRVIVESQAFNRKVEWYPETQKIVIYARK